MVITEIEEIVLTEKQLAAVARIRDTHTRAMIEDLGRYCTAVLIEEEKTEGKWEMNEMFDKIVRTE